MMAGKVRFRMVLVNGKDSWAEYVVVRYSSLLPVPDEIPDQIAAQMLINTITASVLIKAGYSSLKAPITLPVYILQNAAASGVGRLLTQIALDRGGRPIRLVRSNRSAERLRSVLPGPPVYSTSDSNWKKQVREALSGHKLEGLSMPSVEKRSTILQSLLMMAEPSSTSVH
jgi:NADPH:quinone reductase